MFGRLERHRIGQLVQIRQVADSLLSTKRKKAQEALADWAFVPLCFLRNNWVSGSVLLSHTVTHAVPSALKDFTTVFDMGTGVAPSL